MCELSGEFHLFDKAKWQELTGKNVRKSGDIYLGPKYQTGYEIRVLIKKVNQKEE